MSLVSIIIPVYNRAQILPETLDSVISQTYSQWECIIIDDNSTDHTFGVIEKYVETDKRFIPIKNTTDSKGASVARNLGLQKAKGDYIQFLDSDDILANNKIEEQIKKLGLQMVNNKLAVCAWEFFYKASDTVAINMDQPDFKSFDNIEKYFNLIGKIGGFYPPNCFLIPKIVIEKAGYWNENLTLNDDGEFFFRCLINSSGIIFCNKTYVRYRNKSENADNLSLLNSQEKAESLLNSWKIIEALYFTKFETEQHPYLLRKKQSVYSELKKTYPSLIYKNKCFFKKEIREDTFIKRIKKFSKRVKRRFKS